MGRAALIANNRKRLYWPFAKEMAQECTQKPSFIVGNPQKPLTHLGWLKKSKNC